MDYRKYVEKPKVQLDFILKRQQSNSKYFLATTHQGKSLTPGRNERQVVKMTRC